jgi:hypothetical protein
MKYLRNIETGKVVAVENNFFKKTNLCACHTGTGSTIGCMEAGCEESNHIPAVAGEWFDGQNWQSIIMISGSYKNPEWKFVEDLSLANYQFSANQNPRDFWDYEAITKNNLIRGKKCISIIFQTCKAFGSNIKN